MLKAQLMIPRVKGTHDFLDLTLYNYIIATVRAYLAAHNYTEIKTPILEHTELFVRSLGQETDVVSKEMFLIAGDDTLCLRPEATAPTMRAYLEHHIEEKPWKVFSFGPMFRHERPQKGRFREFHQANIEVIGSDSIARDAHLIKMFDRLFAEQFKLDNYALLINFLGTQNDRQKYKEKLDAYLNKVIDQICQTCKVRKTTNILRVLDCKNPTCKELYSKAPHLQEVLSPESLAEFQQLQDQLHLLSVSYTVDPMLVRGLDYYDKTVFEFVSNNLGAQSAFCSGGRYNRLALELGAKEDVPSIGAAMGIERLMLLLEPIQDKLHIPTKPAVELIIPMSKDQEVLALLLANNLLENGVTVDVLLEGGSMKSLMRRANKVGARNALIIGSDEQQKNEVTVKNMMTGDEQRVKQIDVAKFLKK